jgi:DNA-binding response OmpR family regulator
MLTHARPTILIVEDDDVLGRVLAKVLTCDEQIAVHVRTASEALQLARLSRLRLILIDAGLRDGTPLELADAIQGAGGACVPLIWLATHRLDNSALLSRGERLITKSIDLPELRRTVAAALLELPTAGDDVEASSRNGSSCASVTGLVTESTVVNI